MNSDPRSRERTAGRIPAGSLLQYGEVYDFDRYTVLRLPGSAGVKEVTGHFLLAVPEWIRRLLKKTLDVRLKPLLESADEIILGADSNHIELRISILQTGANPDVFCFTMILNGCTIRGHCCLWPLKILSVFAFNRTLKNLQHSLQNRWPT